MKVVKLTDKELLRITGLLYYQLEAIYMWGGLDPNREKKELRALFFKITGRKYQAPRRIG